MKKIKLKMWQIVVLIIVISILTELFSLALQPGAFSQSLLDIVTRPLTIILNLFPVFVLIVLGYFILGNVFFGASIASFICLLFSYINLLKIESRYDVFVPADIELFQEALTSVKMYNIDMHLSYVLIIVFYCVILFCLGILFISPKIKLYIRGLFSVGIVFLFVLSIKYVYSSKEIYNSFSVPQQYNIPSEYNTLGFNYCFLHNINLYPVDKPKGYSKSEVSRWENEYLDEKTNPEVNPNIIFVMGESFSDISNEKVFNWESEKDNPAYKYNLIIQSERCESGHIIVSNICAGTANTEFDVITGLPSIMINDSTTSSFRVVHRNIPTLISILEEVGYTASYIHPDKNWFYNRDNVYSYFGIEDKTFGVDFELKKYTEDGLLLDETILNEIKKKFNVDKSPQFIFGVTIQNHQVYKYSKYIDNTEPVDANLEISNEAMEYVSVYMRGIEDTSEMLYELTKFIDNIDEPTILVFFGDHLPNLGSNYLAYSELDLPVGKSDTVENILYSYKTPFFIYGNIAYSEKVDFDEKISKLELPEDGVINSNYLGSTILELIDLQGYDAYFDYLNYARRILPVFRHKENAYMLYDGTYVDKLEDEIYQDILKKIDWWEYSRLRD